MYTDKNREKIMRKIQKIGDNFQSFSSNFPMIFVSVGEDNIMYLVYHLFFTFTFISLVLQLTVTWDTSISKHIYLYKHYAFNISLLELVFIQYLQPYLKKKIINKNNIVNIHDIHCFVILNIWKY